MIITISGNPGSGKSSAAKMLAERLNCSSICVGQMRRDLARKKGISLEELNEYAKDNPETDVEVDRGASEIAKKIGEKGKVIVEGRTQFYFLPDSIKIYIKVSPEEGAKRIWKDLQDKNLKEQRNEGNILSLKELEEKIVRREEEDAKRYRKYYDIDHRDESHYDLVIDSGGISVGNVVEEIVLFLEKFK